MPIQKALFCHHFLSVSFDKFFDVRFEIGNVYWKTSSALVIMSQRLISLSFIIFSNIPIVSAISINSSIVDNSISCAKGKATKQSGFETSLELFSKNKILLRAKLLIATWIKDQNIRILGNFQIESYFALVPDPPAKWAVQMTTLFRG